MKLIKYCALGNDYFVAPYGGPIPTSRMVRQWCDRHWGGGADGVLYGPIKINGNWFKLKIYNSDGTQSGVSGNGLTIFSRFLKDESLLPEGSRECILNAGQRDITCTFSDSDDILISLGKAHLFPKKFLNIPDEIQQQWSLPSPLLLYPVEVGNPHCIVPVPHLSDKMVQGLGPIIETDPRFKNKTNVQFVVPGPGIIETQVWERGSGYTLASGSSACAVAARILRWRGQKKGTIPVQMPGGRLKVEIDNLCCRFSNRAQRVGIFTVER
jgi:diaminopimelate epimerase